MKPCLLKKKKKKKKKQVEIGFYFKLVDSELGSIHSSPNESGIIARRTLNSIGTKALTNNFHLKLTKNNPDRSRSEWSHNCYNAAVSSADPQSRFAVLESRKQLFVILHPSSSAIIPLKCLLLISSVARRRRRR